MALNAKLGGHYKLKIEGGYSSLQQFYSWSNKSTQKIDAAPYIGISINYYFGKSIFGTFMSQGE